MPTICGVDGPWMFELPALYADASISVDAQLEVAEEVALVSSRLNYARGPAFIRCM